MHKLTLTALSLITRVVSLTAALFATTLAAAQDGGDAQIRTHTMSVQDLTSSLAPTPRLPFRTFLGLRNVEHWPPYVPDRQEYEAVLDPDILIAFLAETDPTFDQDEAELRAENGRLFLRGTANQIQHFRDLVGTARDQFAAPITIDAAVIRHDGKLLPPSVLEPDQARALFEGHPAAWQGAATTPQRMATHLGNHRSVSYAHTNTAHISEERYEALTIQEELFDGVGMVAVAHRVSTGTDLVLQAQFALGSLIGMEAYDTGLGDQPNLQRPQLNTTAANMSGRIKNGGALVFNATAPEGRGGNVLVIVRASCTPSKAAMPEKLLILPATSLTSPGCTLPSFFATEHIALSNPGHDEVDEEQDPQDPILNSDVLIEMISTLVDPDKWEDTATMRLYHGHIIVTAEPETLTKVSAFVGSQERRLLQTLEVSYTNSGGRITLPTLAGRNHAVRHGRETTGVTHAELEIAKKASIKTPSVVRLFDGIEFAIRPYTYDRGLGARIDWFARCIESEPKGVGLPPIRMSTRHHLGAVPSNGLHAGDSPLGQQSWHLRMQ